MVSIDVLTSRFFAYDQMYNHDLREQSFADWPFREDCNCTPEKMAKAGFVHCPSENEPDVACCFFCLIELEGWEPDDDPWSEHAKRSPNCGFLSMKKDFTELTVREYTQLEKDRLKIYLRKSCHKKLASMRDAVDQLLESLKSQLESIE
ncbi:baculoviral IAP repeat-containing protein 5b [Cyprinodon tularosa]|uniref:Baculoviral IAP repeat containing 5b n=1 Tax=Cyprinodon variegatus TaxID=28743 RepID=A0A3Q2DI39_CYPVA|nr:PREDICTED: baculoviral IAP repeat-containing protein 5.1-A-like [Cyprinodon variegatus]XP_038139056.1 baculoviral IAP repeat-containing protein 5b [Cyprinodon tularosa]